MPEPDQAEQNDALRDQLHALQKEIAEVNARLRPTVRRMIGVQILRGVFFGLGSVLGATLVVSLVIYSLSSINFIPIIGDWAAQIAERIRNN